MEIEEIKSIVEGFMYRSDPVYQKFPEYRLAILIEKLFKDATIDPYLEHLKEKSLRELREIANKVFVDFVLEQDEFREDLERVGQDDWFRIFRGLMIHFIDQKWLYVWATDEGELAKRHLAETMYIRKYLEEVTRKYILWKENQAP
ncbi:hypothetical protein [Thermococcus sp.]